MILLCGSIILKNVFDFYVIAWAIVSFCGSFGVFGCASHSVSVAYDLVLKVFMH